MNNKKLKASSDSAEYGHRKIINYNSDYDFNFDEAEQQKSVKINKVSYAGKSDTEEEEVVTEVDEDEDEDDVLKRKIPLGKLSLKTDDQIVSQFLNLSSNDHKTRLEAFKKLNKFKEKGVMRKELKRNIFKVIENEILKDSGSFDIRIEALRVLNGLRLNKMELKTCTIDLLRLAYKDPNYLVRSEALNTLKWVINQSIPFNWKELTALLDKDPKESFNENRYEYSNDPHDILSSLPRGSLKPNEIVFSVVSFIASNDTHFQVRLIAMDFFTKIPGKISQDLIGQSIKKDQCKYDFVDVKSGEGSGSKRSAKVKPESSNSSSNSKRKSAHISTSKSCKFPLLCCGVFAHGIEDQFVKIRFSSLKSYHNLLLKNSINNDPARFCIFLDALLDECDLIRLTALKLLGSLKNDELTLTIDFGLESLLAVLDDQNYEIRGAALNLIKNKLKISSSKSSNSSSEIMLRSLKCLEAALTKYPEMEKEYLETSLKLVQRTGRDVLIKKCPEFHSILMQTSHPKYLIPPSILGNLMNNSNNNLMTTIQSIMQIPFLKDETASKIRLVKLASRLPLNPADPLNFLTEFPEIFNKKSWTCDAYEKIFKSEIVGKCKNVQFSCDEEQVELFKRLVVRGE